MNPVPPIISASKKLKAIVGSDSWKILRVAGYLKENVGQYIGLIGQGKGEFDEFNKIMKNSTESTTLRKEILGSYTVQG